MGSSREYYEKNAPRIRAKSREWSAKNPERKRETVRALLCAGCNAALGALERMEGRWLGMAEAYLSQFAEHSILERRADYFRGDWRTDEELVSNDEGRE